MFKIMKWGKKCWKHLDRRMVQLNYQFFKHTLSSILFFWHQIMDCSLEVCVPECNFLGTAFFPKKSRKFPIQSIWEHPLSRHNLIPAFGTCFFMACLRLGNIREFPNASRMKIINFNLELVKTFPTGTDLLIKFSTRQYFPDKSWFLYEGSYVRLNALNVLHLYGPCLNAPKIDYTKSMLRL